MVRYHLGLDGEAPRGKRMRPLIGLLAYQSIAGDHARALPGAAAVEMGHNFSLVHDDIEDRGAGAPPPPRAVDGGRHPAGHQHRGHALHPQPHGPLPAHRRGLRGRPRAAPHAPLRRDLPGALRRPVHGHLELRARRVDVRGRLLRHDRPQDGRAHRRLRRGRGHAGHRGRGRHRGLPALRLVAGPGLPAQRRPAGHLGRRSRDRQGGLGHRDAQEDPAAHLRAGGGRGSRRCATPRHPGPVGRAGRSRGGRGGAAILERVGAHEYTRERARQHRDEALAEIASVPLVDGEAIDRLRSGRARRRSAPRGAPGRRSPLRRPAGRRPRLGPRIAEPRARCARGDRRWPPR